ncbi:MAG TPA: hypothetical protein DCP69_07925 [Candidatus Omnitrophica bacterium]|nr:hypothetical protein [Candidatus Omnitrophota bacterium]
MARKRLEGTQLGSWEDVDQALHKIGVIDRELAVLEAGQNARIDAVKKETKEAAQPLQEKKSGIELAVKDYCEANRAEFVKTKSKQLTFGEVGFRLSTSILIKKVAETLQALKDLQYFTCIRTKEEPDKESMKSLTDEVLAEVGASRKTVNTFGYTLDVEKIREAS